jgi:hypothetical protein
MVPQFDSMLENASGKLDIIRLPNQDQERFRLFENWLRVKIFNLKEESEQLGLETGGEDIIASSFVDYSTITRNTRALVLSQKRKESGMTARVNGMIL